MAEDGYLTGQLLIAMPTMGDPRFERTVIYLCAHSADGAMGLVVNKAAHEIDFPELLSQLEIDTGDIKNPIPVLTGGPVETGRGFVLHSMDYSQDSTLKVSDDVGLTATVDILRAIAEGAGPARSLLTLGYAGVYSSFLLFAKRSAEKYGLSSRDTLMELGRRRTVGGQEDMIEDLALDMAR